MTIRDKINSFRRYPDGWHYGEGRAFSESVLSQIIRLSDYANGIGLIEQNVFPGPNGEVQLSLYDDKYVIDIIATYNDGIELTLEENDDETENATGLTERQVVSRLNQYASS